MAEKVKKEKQSFEQRLEKLEALAEQMEQGDLPLNQLLALYEEGLMVSHQLEAELATTKARMMEIKEAKGGRAQAKPSQVVVQESLLDEAPGEE